MQGMELDRRIAAGIGVDGMETELMKVL